MKRAVAILVMLAAGAQVVMASGAPEKVAEVVDELSGTAAVGGRFVARPPTETGLPIDILLKMRRKLSGDTTLPEAEGKADEGNGH